MAVEDNDLDRQAFYDQETYKLVEILKRANPRRVIRFGSTVTGTMGRDSDLDLCILLEEAEGMPRFRRAQQLYRLLTDSEYRWPVDVDLRVYSPQEYAERLRQGDPFVQEIAKGEIVYER